MPSSKIQLVQQQADSCLYRLEGIHFCMATCTRDTEQPQAIAIVSLTAQAVFNFCARHMDGRIRRAGPDIPPLTWQDLTLPEAGYAPAS